jgi:hypothetical protein
LPLILPLPLNVYGSALLFTVTIAGWTVVVMLTVVVPAARSLKRT